MADVFEYIVRNTPDATLSDFCHQAGYRCESDEDAYEIIKKVAMQGNDEDFVAVMSMHPDKDLLVELFSNPTPSAPSKNKEILNKMLVHTNQADGGVSIMRGVPQGHENAFNTTNALLLFGVVALIGIAIVIK